jgi:hypothetical protein
MRRAQLQNFKGPETHSVTHMAPVVDSLVLSGIRLTYSGFMTASRHIVFKQSSVHLPVSAQTCYHKHFVKFSSSKEPCYQLLSSCLHRHFA